ncbi:MAG: polysaccharide deacetylase family protein [Ferruginibacter sp.]|nr:polysaccharide deacetylase family protein [Ferruginibacter sp.]
MDADPEGSFNYSMLFKASLLTITFSSIYFYKTENQFSLFRTQFAKKEKPTVKQFTKPIIKKKKKTIFLTFDDGPCKGSKKVMQILQKENVPATLFVIGEHVYGSREQATIFDSLQACNLIEISNHSYTHAFHNSFYKFYSMPDSATNDFTKCADSLHFTTNIIRTTGRNIWRTENIISTDLKASAQAADSLYSKGFVAIG